MCPPIDECGDRMVEDKKTVVNVVDGISINLERPPAAGKPFLRLQVRHKSSFVEKSGMRNSDFWKFSNKDAV